MLDFEEYPSMVLRLLNNCIQAPQAHMAVLLIEPSGCARLDFIQVVLLSGLCISSCLCYASARESPEDEGQSEVCSTLLLH